MKVMASIILVAAFSTLGTPYVHGEDATDAFVGTWVLETFQNGSDTPKDFTATKEPREILLITGPHFIYGRLSPSTNKLVELRQCGTLLHRKESNSYEEHIEAGNKNMIGKVYPFTLKFDQNKRLIKERNLTTGINAGKKQRQVWVRFDEVLTNAQQDSSTLGDKLIGLKKAYDAGALTEREYQQQKAKLLDQK